MIKASMFTGRLSELPFIILSAKISKHSTLSTLIVSQLKDILGNYDNIKPELIDKYSIFLKEIECKLIHKYSVFLPANLCESLTKLSISLGVSTEVTINWLLLLPVSDSEPAENNELPPNCTESQLGGNSDIEIPLEAGYLRLKIIKNQRYWYWRYYTKQGKRADIYMGTDHDRALSKAKQIGIPEDANSKHKRRKINAR